MALRGLAVHAPGDEIYVDQAGQGSSPASAIRNAIRNLTLPDDDVRAELPTSTAAQSPSTGMPRPHINRVVSHQSELVSMMEKGEVAC
jgi:hypothetical protein